MLNISCPHRNSPRSVSRVPSRGLTIHLVTLPEPLSCLSANLVAHCNHLSRLQYTASIKIIQWTSTTAKIMRREDYGDSSGHLIRRENL